MARVTEKLTEKQIMRDGMKPGRHGDGGGLFLLVSKAGTKSWVFLFSFATKRHEIGCGAFPAVSLAAARGVADAHRKTIKAGINPAAKATPSAVKTFGMVVADFIAAKGKPWTEPVRNDWSAAFQTHAAKLMATPIGAVDTDAVVDCLNALDPSRVSLAAKLRSRIERVISFARAKKLYPEGQNPATHRGHLDDLMSGLTYKPKKHHAALPYVQAPAVYADVITKNTTACDVLAFIMQTAVRSVEAREVTWAEVDLKAKLWTIPASRMKARKEHIIPLTDAALAILDRRRAVDPGAKPTDLIFPSPMTGRALDGLALSYNLRKITGGTKLTTHGLRSCFRDYLGSETETARDIAELCLAHAVGDATERAYRRSDAIERRRIAMQQWSDYLQPREAVTV